MKPASNPQTLIKNLQRLREQHGFRAETLVPDIAFLGLVDDCIDAAQTSLDLLDSPRPHRAYSMVRVAYEASQRLLPLAASADYVRLGTRAWLYYRRKDALIAGDAEQAVAPAQKQIIDLWATHFPKAHQIVAEESAVLHKLKGRPDNFFDRDLAEAEAESYSILAQQKDRSASADNTRINRDLYRLLSRDAHACLRLTPSRLIVDSDGFVDVEDRPRDRTEVANNVTAGLGAILKGSIAAVLYRLFQRRQTHAARLLASLNDLQVDVTHTSTDDVGRLAAQHGLAQDEVVFASVPIDQIFELQDQTLTTTVKMGPGANASIVTFDFKGHVRQTLLAIAKEVFPDAALTAHHSGFPIMDLPYPIMLTLKAELGTRKDTKEESFVPFIVTEVRRAGISR